MEHGGCIDRGHRVLSLSAKSTTGVCTVAGWSTTICTFISALDLPSCVTMSLEWPVSEEATHCVVQILSLSIQLRHQFLVFKFAHPFVLLHCSLFGLFLFYRQFCQFYGPQLAFAFGHCRRLYENDGARAPLKFESVFPIYSLSSS